MDDLASIERATAPARWLLERGLEGIPLTQTSALARVVVREAAERWPGWWNAQVHGPPHREADMALLGAVHESLRRLRLLRRRGGRLLTTARGRAMLQDPAALLAALAADLGGGHPFTEAVAASVTRALAAADQTHAELATRALSQVGPGWQHPDGRPPNRIDVSSVVGAVVRRGEAYGLFERRPDPARPHSRGTRIALSDAGRLALGSDAGRSIATNVLVFDADLVGVRGVGARLVLGESQHLTGLHDAIQEAFGWGDDHLYSFWLDGRFWGDRDQEYTAPLTPDEGRRTADVPLAELDLAVGATIAYIFDFGDEWRVRLTLRERTAPDGGHYPRVLSRKGTPPPQYPPLDEGEE